MGREQVLLFNILKLPMKKTNVMSDIFIDNVFFKSNAHWEALGRPRKGSEKVKTAKFHALHLGEQNVFFSNYGLSG